MPDFNVEVLGQLGRMNDKLDAIREDVSETKERVATLEAAHNITLPQLQRTVSNLEAQVGSRASTEWVGKIEAQVHKLSEDNASARTKFNFISWIGGIVTSAAFTLIIKLLTK